MAEHARLPPSAVTRWRRCAGSVDRCASLPDTRHEYSAEGTVAHRIRESALRYGLSAWDFVGNVMVEDGYTFTITNSWADYLQPGIEKIEDLVADLRGTLYLERRVPLDRWMPGQFGTLDVGIVSKKLIVINDLKYGIGVEVDSFENEQMMLYGLGFWDSIARHKTDAEDVLLMVDQPRIAGASGQFKTTVSDLLRFGEKIKKAAAATYGKDAKFKAGIHQCRFCPAAEHNVCPEFVEFNLATLGVRMEDFGEWVKTGQEPQLTRKQAMTPAERSYVALHAPLIRKWLDANHNAVLADASAGRPTPGLALGMGRKGVTQWENPKKAERYLGNALGDDAYNIDLKSPNQIKDTVGTKEYKKILTKVGTVQAEGKPVLIPETSNKKRAPTFRTRFQNLDKVSGNKRQ